MDKLIIDENFQVDVPTGKNEDGSDRPHELRQYTKGMLVSEADIPEGHTAQDWIDKGHAHRGRSSIDNDSHDNAAE